MEHKLMLSWIVFSLLTGTTEAIYFNKNKRHVKLLGKNIHLWFTLFRTLVASPIVIWVLFNIGALESLLFSLIMILIFPFYHDGMYYTVRELLKKGTYKRYWMDQSKNTDAKFSFNFVIRTVFLIIALLIYPY